MCPATFMECCALNVIIIKWRVYWMKCIQWFWIYQGEFFFYIMYHPCICCWPLISVFILRVSLFWTLLDTLYISVTILFKIEIKKINLKKTELRVEGSLQYWWWCRLTFAWGSLLGIILSRDVRWENWLEEGGRACMPTLLHHDTTLIMRVYPFDTWLFFVSFIHLQLPVVIWMMALIYFLLSIMSRKRIIYYYHYYYLHRSVCFSRRAQFFQASLPFRGSMIYSNLFYIASGLLSARLAEASSGVPTTKGASLARPDFCPARNERHQLHEPVESGTARTAGDTVRHWLEAWLSDARSDHGFLSVI